MWIISRKNETTKEYLMFDTGTFRKCREGMPKPYKSVLDAMHEMDDRKKAEPWWDYDVEEFLR